VSVRGTIIRVGSMKPAAKWMAFSCLTCSDVQTVRQPQGIFTQPTKCRTNGCRSRSFAPCRSSQFTQTVNWQTIRLQEIAADEQVNISASYDLSGSRSGAFQFYSVPLVRVKDESGSCSVSFFFVLARRWPRTSNCRVRVAGRSRGFCCSW